MEGKEGKEEKKERRKCRREGGHVRRKETFGKE